jgi:hypothetical protein
MIGDLAMLDHEYLVIGVVPLARVGSSLSFL